ncbi:MAG: metal-dependent hydrolase [Cyclobacteriaceae bacterium]
MASIFGHALVGATLKETIYPNGSYKWTSLALVSTMIPDVDVITFSFGIPYESAWGHRGFSHSIVFALGWALILVLLFSPKNKFGGAILIFFSTLSHGLLDSMTNGGLGVAFLAPFDDYRFFAPWRPIQVSPIGASAFFSSWGLEVILSELLWIGIPCTVIWLVTKFIPRKTTTDDH